MNEKYRFLSTLAIWLAFATIMVTMFISLAASSIFMDELTMIILGVFVLTLTLMAGISTAQIWRGARAAEDTQAAAEKTKRAAPSQIERLIDRPHRPPGHHVAEVDRCTGIQSRLADIRKGALRRQHPRDAVAPDLRDFVFGHQLTLMFGRPRSGNPYRCTAPPAWNCGFWFTTVGVFGTRLSFGSPLSARRPPKMA